MLTEVCRTGKVWQPQNIGEAQIESLALEQVSAEERLRLSKIGHPRLSKALYCPAMTPPFREAASFPNNGLFGNASTRQMQMAVIGAAMRKLLIYSANGGLKTGKRFDRNWATNI